ncbi:deoxyguanosinetriphosphate triphosphohydrolase [Sporanaerobium hydrogeniformans]|uniref:Deoxyguanosinetriphosphate triphosphohydrolase n=1 Tax=Sporanaerobium hydrogeniformans TaxID=3072179 RepID=A0AC61DFX3_9FIRM|nr:dNTP triphosphohydrolase [Sporanaerobium hydrogeniformans]PHV72210.1 deoxyguanosinetriphosphate triphosphohydrolase [Sporanaerobium hydrogeniformans]
METILKWEKLLCTERQRISSSNVTSHRNEFDKDYDRIIASSSVRRLQDKAQVFPLQENDFTRTRLTHSLEASAIARSFGLAIGEKLVEKGEFSEVKQIYQLSSLLAVAGLIHDLGNPPFGHYGEDIIRKWFTKWFHSVEFNEFNEEYRRKNKKDSITEQEKEDFIRFEGNAQTLRIISKLQFMNDQYGVNFTYATMATIMKYPWKSTDSRARVKNKFGFFVAEHNVANKIFEKTGIDKGRHAATYLLEASDDIAYLLADVEDGVKKGIIDWDLTYKNIKEALKNEEQLKEIFKELDEKNKKAEENMVPGSSLISMQNFKVAMQGILFVDCRNTFMEYYDDIMNCKFEGDLLGKGKVSNLVKQLQEVTRQTCFIDREVLTLELVGENVIEGLLDRFVAAIAFSEKEPSAKVKEGKLYKLISDNFIYICKLNEEGKPEKTFENFTLYDKLILITDFITGMTDSYAVNLYKELIGIKLP